MEISLFRQPARKMAFGGLKELMIAIPIRWEKTDADNEKIATGLKQVSIQCPAQFLPEGNKRHKGLCTYRPFRKGALPGITC